MIAVIQRVERANVSIDGALHSEIGKGLLVLLGVKQGDEERDAQLLAKKISNLRIFSDENGKMNLSVLDVCGSVLVVSNFTLLANYKKGNRPDYMNGAKPDEANRLYERFCELISEFVPTQRGVFGADMQIDLINDGPVTIVMDSEVLK